MNEDQNHLESEPDELSPEAGIVCLACLAPNSPHANYCSECGALVNTLLAFNPFDQTLAEGFAYRRAVEGPPSKVLLIGIWLLFAPTILTLPFIPSSTQAVDPNSGPFTNAIGRAYYFVYIVSSLVIVYRTTANYLSKRKLLNLPD